MQYPPAPLPDYPFQPSPYDQWLGLFVLGLCAIGLIAMLLPRPLFRKLMKAAFPFLALLLFAGRAMGQEKPLPDAPKPKQHSVSKVWLAEASILAGLYTADFSITAANVHRTTCVTSLGGIKTVCSLGIPEADPLYGNYPSRTRLALTTAALYGVEVFALRKTEASKHRAVRWGGRAGFALLTATEGVAIASWVHKKQYTTTTFQF